MREMISAHPKIKFPSPTTADRGGNVQQAMPPVGTCCWRQCSVEPGDLVMGDDIVSLSRFVVDNPFTQVICMRMLTQESKDCRRLAARVESGGDPRGAHCSDLWWRIANLEKRQWTCGAHSYVKTRVFNEGSPPP